MGHALTITIPDNLRQPLIQAASVKHQTPEQWVMMLIQRQLPPRDLRLRRHFGAVNLGHPTGADNEQIDDDLSRAYADELLEK
jgi:hypothetical protein